MDKVIELKMNPGKRITLEEARLLALDISRWVEEGLANDRAEEARMTLMIHGGEDTVTVEEYDRGWCNSDGTYEV